MDTTYDPGKTTTYTHGSAGDLPSIQLAGVKFFYVQRSQRSVCREFVAGQVREQQKSSAVVVMGVEAAHAAFSGIVAQKAKAHKAIAGAELRVRGDGYVLLRGGRFAQQAAAAAAIDSSAV